MQCYVWHEWYIKNVGFHSEVIGTFDISNREDWDDIVLCCTVFWDNWCILLSKCIIVLYFCFFVLHSEVIGTIDARTILECHFLLYCLGQWMYLILYCLGQLMFRIEEMRYCIVFWSHEDKWYILLRKLVLFMHETEGQWVQLLLVE